MERKGTTRQQDGENRVKFLHELIETKSPEIAAKNVGISISTAYKIAKKYSNILEAQFETLGLKRIDVMKQHADMITEPPVKLRVDKSGAVHEEVNAAVQLEAMKLYYDITGLKKNAENDITIINAINTETQQESEIFKTLPEDVKAKLRAMITKTRSE